MKKYRVEGISVMVNGGIVVLTDKQAGKRSHALKSLGYGRYEVLSPVGFKRGEEFGFNGSINKSLLTELSDISKKSPEDETEKQAAARAKKEEKKARAKAKRAAKKKAKLEAEAKAKAKESV